MHILKVSIPRSFDIFLLSWGTWIKLQTLPIPPQGPLISFPRTLVVDCCNTWLF